ncbi:CPSF A subunit region-domain-containing protein, partial [Mycena leptocephala]
QRQIVTCSGAQNTGSIHVMRKGADFLQLATVSGMAHTIGVFPLRTTSDAVFDSHVLVSTLQETHAFEMSSNQTLNKLESDAEFVRGRTLAVRNVKRGIFHDAIKRGNTIVAPERTDYEHSPFVIQVTSDGAFLLQSSMGFTNVYDYKVAEREGIQGLQVVAASINTTQTVLALNNGWLLCLEVDKSNTLILKRKSTSILHHGEVSALSCTPLDTSSDASEFVVVAYWQTNYIEILHQVQGDFVSVYKTKPLGAVVRSLLLYDFGSTGDSHPYLLAGLGDGSFLSFPWNEQQRTLGDPTLTSLGDLPVCFTPCSVDKKKGKALFAAGTRAMVLLWQRDSIHHSPVILKALLAASQLHTQHYNSALILANDSALFVGEVRDVGKMHIRSIPLGLDAPQRIAYEPSLKMFGVACTRREPTRVGTPEPAPSSSFRLLDDTTFSPLSQYNCAADEEITCITTLSLTQDKDVTAFFCLGTYTLKSDESEPETGRLLVFTAYPQRAESWSSNAELSLAASTDVRGCVYSITTVNGLIAAGVNSAVMLFRLEMDQATKHCKLHKVSSINLNYFVTSLVGYENKLVVGDRITSVSLLEVSENRKIRTLGRDMTPLSPVCVQAVNGKHIIAANDTLNLLSFTLDEENRKLDRDGFYQQSDLINKFVPGTYKSLPPRQNLILMRFPGSITAPDAGSKLEPIQLFFASSGRIGVIVDIADRQLGLDLTSLQRNMANVFEDGRNHTTFRTPQSTARRRTVETAYGFLDGDFLERLLTAPPAQLAKIVAGTNEPERLKRPLHEFQQLLKSLQALH